MKKYSIVRVDGECPKGLGEDMYCKWCGNCGRIYGDTKEQLIRKVAQVIFKAKIERYMRVWKCDCSNMEKRDRYKDSLVIAKEIVEFLGVK